MRALITGIIGQDGYYLSELLLSKGYDVYGLLRCHDVTRCDHLNQAVRYVYGDLHDSGCLIRILKDICPHEIYNLAGPSNVVLCDHFPETVAQAVALGPLRILEAIRMLTYPVKFFQASSAEMFGCRAPSVQSEETLFFPESSYATAKLMAHGNVVNYRHGYKMFACNGIMFNHESPRRSSHFVTRKITLSACRIRLGLQKKLCLGNIDVVRDWGFAGDFVEAMWLMLQQDHADDYVVATGETHSIKEFLQETFGLLDMDWEKHVEIDPALCRQRDIPVRCGDAGKAKNILRWTPKVSFKELVAMMVEADMQALNCMAAC